MTQRSVRALLLALLSLLVCTLPACGPRGTEAPPAQPSEERLIEPGQTKCYGDLEVTAFATSHDAVQPQYYVFSSGGKRLACLTDTGYVSEEVEYEIQDADAYLLEFNYDDLMLRSGPYPWSLQQRDRKSVV